MDKHTIAHIEIASKDLEAAGKFYHDVFGWGVQQIPESNYAMCDLGGDLGVGLNPVSQQYPAGTVLVYIGADDIDATLAKIESAGGKIKVPRTEILGTGWFAMFEDPSGNTLGLYKPEPRSG